MRISRRRFTGTTLGALTVAASSLGHVRANAEVEEDVSDLKPGQFVWYPERAQAGPMVIVVSLPDQRVYVYRNGIRIGVSTCATGRPGHATPTGVFTILQKDKDHHSSLYHNAPMPFTERLTCRASRCMRATCQDIRTPMAACTCRSSSRNSCFTRPSWARR